jgi:TP901 family phage tail tape measure protein
VADQLGSAVLTLSVDDSQFNAGLQRAQSTVQQVGGSLQAALGTLGLATSAAGIAAFVGNQVTQLDAAAAAVRTLGVDSQELGTRLRALSVELNNNISTLDLTKAAYDVASSGFSSAADATQILRASALGAKGGFAEVNDVASALTGVINAYGLSASDATKIVDGFVQTQADGVITVRQYAAEIGNIASIAAASGVGIEELNAAIATATLRGVPVAQTFTGLRQALSSIIKPSEQAKELAESLGIQFNVGALQAKGLGGVLADVQQKTGGAADKIAILLGSVEAQAAVQPLLNDQLVKYNELLGKQAQSSGAAADAARINAGTISDGLKQIGNGFSNLATTLDKVLSPLFAGFISSINNVLAKLNQVAALAPDKVLAREREATDAVAGQLFPGQGSGFFGPVTVKYKGKTYKGSAAGIREAILQDLLKGELAKVNAPAASGGGKAASSVAKVAPEAEKALTGLEALKKALSDLEKQQAVLSVDSSAFVAANQQILQTQDAIEQLDGKKAIITVEQINAGVQDGSLTNNFSNLEKRSQAAQQALNSAAFDSPEFQRALRAAQEANFELDQRRKMADPNAISKRLEETKQKAEQAASDGLKKAFDLCAEAARSTAEAQNSFRSALEGSFDLLTSGKQNDLLNAARNDLQRAVNAGFFDSGKVAKLTDKELVGAAAQARSVIEASDKLNGNQSKLISSNAALEKATADLVQKNWAVNVSVNAATGGYAVNLG